jgi:L-fuculose-phosphate aldolase
VNQRHLNIAKDVDVQKLRVELNNSYKELIALGLNRGTSGNCSARLASNQCLITPSGVAAIELTPASMTQVTMDGHVLSNGKPSSEWRLHCDILSHRPEINAVVHTHSVAATALACLRKDIPPFHYMVAVAGGDSIRCAPYALFGSQSLSDYALIALVGRKACLMANHGVVALGVNLTEAVQLALEVETLADQYLRALAIGEPCILSASEMLEVSEQFKAYGYKSHVEKLEE